MSSQVELPDGSIYLWMYRQGLKKVPLKDIVSACMLAGREIRPKDEQNYWNGWYRSCLYGEHESHPLRIPLSSMPTSRYPKWENLPSHPFICMPEIANRWVPCTKDGRPLIKWGGGCLMLSEAQAYRGCGSLAENLRGTKMIAIDFDGDHDGIDMECVRLAEMWSRRSTAWLKPDYVMGMSKSVHVIFKVNKEVPTMHFPKARIDIIGNQKNSIRYLKNKKSNGRPMADMTEELWDELMSYVREREEA